MMFAAALLAVSLDSVLSILWVVLGLGLVIFFHELGHFAVAKWCNVNVERFSIGFGPILWSRKRGETEYALSAVPFGGYVKMLGQDDIDPSQLTSEEIAQDPRSYSAKPVWQRMAIISAGVIMNIITGVIFFMLAFGIGPKTPPPLVGGVETGMPAWQAGLQRGDKIRDIDGRPVDTFLDIYRASALSSGKIVLSGVHPDGSEFTETLTPDVSGTKPVIGIGFMLSTRLSGDKDHPPVIPGTPAAQADPPFQPDDVIRQVDGRSISSFIELQDILAKQRGESLTLGVERKGTKDLVTITVPPYRFRTLGLWMDSGQITAIKEDSPAARAGLQVGDKLAKVDGRNVGQEINPLRLPDMLAERAGSPVEIVVTRPAEGGGTREFTVSLVPDAASAWLEQPNKRAGLPIPALGLAFHVLPYVLKVEPGSPAAKAGIPAQVTLERMDLIPPRDVADDRWGQEPITLKFGGDDSDNWATAFWTMQETPLRTVVLSVKHEGKVKDYTLKPQVEDDWFLPRRGMVHSIIFEKQQARSIGEAFVMGMTHTRNSILEIYLTLRSLATQRVSVQELRGPLGIAGVAYDMARQGPAELLLFLGFLSVNLAVLNFLPIPVLDGGHMVFLIWEGITRRRPSERVMVAATYLGMAFVLGLMLLVIYLDIFVHGFGRN